MDYFVRGSKVSRSSAIFALRRGDPITIKNNDKTVYIKTAREDEDDLVYVVQHGGLQESVTSWLEAIKKADNILQE